LPIWSLFITNSEQMAGDLAGRTAAGALLKIDFELVLAEVAALRTRRHLGQQGQASFGKALSIWANAVGAIAQRSIQLQAAPGLRLLSQLDAAPVIIRVPCQDVNAHHQLALNVGRHRQLVAVETSARALATMPHLRVVDGADPLPRGALAN